MSGADRFGRARDSEGLAKTLMMLRNRWLIVVSVVLACVLVAVVHHERAAKSYSATASVAFQSGTLSDAALQVTPGGTAEPQREADTEVLIAHSPEVALGVRRQLHTLASSSELLSEVKVEAAPNANVLNIVAASGDPRYSARLANAFAEQYIAFRTRSELAGIETAQAKLHQQIASLPAGSPERTTLQQSLQRLGELRAVAGGGANIIGLATPVATPTGPSLTSTVIVGLLIGLAVAFSLVFLLGIARPTRQDDRGVRARVPAAGARGRTAIGFPLPACKGSHGFTRALSHPAQRARLRRRHARARHAACDQRGLR